MDVKNIQIWLQEYRKDNITGFSVKHRLCLTPETRNLLLTAGYGVSTQNHERST